MIVELQPFRIRLGAETLNLPAVAARIQRRGDLSRLLEEALYAVNWDDILPYDRRNRPELWESGENATEVSVTTVSMPVTLLEKLKAYCKTREVSSGRICEAALRYWAEMQSGRPAE